MEIKTKNLSYQDFLLNIEIDGKNIIGITGSGKTTVLKLLSLQLIGKGDIIYDNEKIKKENRATLKRKNSYVASTFQTISFLNTVREYMEYYIKRGQLEIKDPNKKIKDSLRIIGLEQEKLNQNIIELSTSEKKLIQIAICLLSNPNYIFLDEPFLNLDMKTIKRLYMLLIRLKEQYQKTIIIASNNSDQLYQYTDQMVFLKKHQVFLSAPTKEAYAKVAYLTKNGFEVPDITKFTYKAKNKKNVKIEYHKDIRDIIKDIYKHV